MRPQKERKCPVEDYGAEIAGEVLPGIYAHQQECAETHGCVRDVCLLDGAWPEEILGREDFEEDPAPESPRAGYGSNGSEVTATWECLSSD